MDDTRNYWIDTHAHIYLQDFDQDRETILERASGAGVGAVYMPNIDNTTIERMLDVEAMYSTMCRSMMGLHPCSVKENFKEELIQLEKQLSRHQFIAIGEMGTDLYWDKNFWKEQKEAFVIQARWAAQMRLPMVIHCRESLDETIELLGGIQNGDLRGVFHCFTGNARQAETIIGLGFHLGIGGVVTFKNTELRMTLESVPAEYVIIETDSPYLAPTPNRGRRNEPAYVPLVGDTLAAVWKKDVAEVRRITTDNTLRLFSQL